MKFLFSLLLLLVTPVFAFADVIPDTIYAVTPKYINSTNLEKNEKLELYVLKTGKLSEKLNLKHGEKIEVKVLDYIEPKRGKRNGYYKIQYIGNELMTGSMRPSNPKDIKKIAAGAGVAIAGTILKVPGFSQAVAISKGLIMPNKNESRLESAGENLYKSTPLTYTEKGKDFEVEEDGVVVLKIKSVI